MKVRFPHRRSSADDKQQGKPIDPFVLADRACCCPARPVVAVMLPPTPAVPHPVDLLLCGHHFRASQAALTAAGATVLDRAALLARAGAAGAAGLTRSEFADVTPRG